MSNRLILQFVEMMLVIWVAGGLLLAQQAPNTILYNGKIVTVDDHGVNGNLGTIAQAIAVRGDRILAVGSNSQIRALAGPNTKSIDLKGRTVTPGLAATHDHPQLWDPMNPYIMQKVVNDNMHIERFLWEGTPEEKLQKFPKVLEEAVQKAKPGQWIRISLLEGKKYDYGETTKLAGYLGRQINKQNLDLAAPNNPVLVRQGLLGAVLNQKAIDEVKKFYGERWIKLVGQTGEFDPASEQTGVNFGTVRRVEEDVIYTPDEFREILRLGGSWWAGYGLTMNSTAMYAAGSLNAWSSLDKAGQLSFRLPWSWLDSGGDEFFNPQTLASMVALQGQGSDYMWLVGFWPAGMTKGDQCTSWPGTSPKVKQKEPVCGLDPVSGKREREVLYNVVKAGGRLSGAHTDGDKNMDYVMDLIEQASRDAGMTLDQIRAKRHGWDHEAYNPRPDQIPRIKNLGIQLGGWDLYIWQGQGQQVLKDYGEEAAQSVVPRKNLLNAGVRESVEIDRPLGYTDLTFFTVLQTGVTRKDQNGQIFAPQQAVSREVMLKSATLSGAYYGLREDRLGSLEPGKLADLIILDRDYLTIPEDDISKIRVLMTMLGGKVVHLVPSLAREIGMQPTGSQITLGGPAAQW